MRIGVTILLLSFFCKQIFAQVNLQTGAAEQSFPLINYADSKSGLTFGISANYSSGNGLAVNSLASNLGTGWTLGAGGVIMRLQNGQPDDQPENDNGYLTTDESLKRYPAGYLYNNGIGQGCPNGNDVFPLFKGEETFKQKNSIAADLQQDRFVFSMNGRGGSFIINKDWQAITIGDSRVKISISTPKDMTAQGIRTTIESFTITTEDGIKYTFNEKALQQICRYKYSELRDGKWSVKYGRPIDQPKRVNRFYGYPLTSIAERPYIVNAWYLTSIENTNNGEKILLEYDDVSHDIITAKYISHSKNLNWSTTGTGIIPARNADDHFERIGRGWYNMLSDPEWAFAYSVNTTALDKLASRSTSITYLRSISKSKRIKRVLFPDNSSVLFHYDWRPRADITNESTIQNPDNALTRIDYLKGQQFVRGFEFEHGYFYKNLIRGIDASFTSFEKKFARLCLLSIRKIGNGIDNVTEPPYRFSYWMGDPNSTDNFIPSRNTLSQDHAGYYNGPVSDLSQTEDHDFLSDAENQYLKTVLFRSHLHKTDYAKNGLLRKVEYPTGGTLEYEYGQNKIIFKTNEFEDVGVSVQKTTLYNGEDHSKDIVTEFSYVLPNGKSSRWGYERPSYTSVNHTVHTLNKLSGYKYPGLDYPEMAVNSPAATFNWGNFLLKSAISYVMQNSIASILPSGAVPGLNLMFLVLGLYDLFSNLNEDHHFYGFVLTNSNDMLSNPVGGLYSRAEVKTSSPLGYNGKIIYEYTSDQDYPLLEKSHKWPYVPKQRSADWVYGLLKRVTVLDKENKIVSEKKNDYDIYLEKIADIKNINCSCVSATQSSTSSDKYQGISGFKSNDIVYYYYTGRADLNSVQQKEYVNENPYYSSTTNIATDPLTLLPKGEMVFKDKNTILIKRTLYPHDYDLPGAIAQLKTNNAIHTPIATETLLLKIQWSGFPTPFPFITPYLLDANVTEFKVYTFNGKQVVKPWKTYALKAKTPIFGGLGHSRDKLLFDPEQYKETSEMFYDTDGNLIETKSDDQVSSFINDYSNRLAVASVANASYHDIAYNSFESNGIGNWNFNASNIVSTGAVTGSKSYQLTPTSTITNQNVLNTNNTYTVTYWYKSTGSTASAVNGTAGELLYQGNDGWKLFRHTISGATNVSISGDGQIDEVRLYPSGALMSTVSYLEGIGKVTECDANNRLLFYEYDGLGRLKMIRDQNKNVIKTYEYNYKK